MYDDVQPTPDGKFGRVLPRLKSIPTVKVMGRLPVIENLVTVLNRRIQCCQYIEGGECIESNNRPNEGLVGRWVL